MDMDLESEIGGPPMICFSDPAWDAAILSCGIGFTGGVTICGAESLMGFLWTRRPAFLRRGSLRRQQSEILRLRRLALMLDETRGMGLGLCPNCR